MPQREHHERPDFANEMGVRAKIEVSRSSPLAAIGQVENPFSKFRLYRFPPDGDRGLFACLISAAREKGVKRAMALLSTDEALAIEFQAILEVAPLGGPPPRSGEGQGAHCRGIR